MAAGRTSRTHRTLTRIGVAGLLAAMVAASCAAQPSKAASGFSGTRALADVRKLVAIGPRVAGTPGAAKARDYITEQLKAAGLAVQEQAFDASTPRGSVHMINLLAVIPGIPPPEAPSQVPVQRLIVAGHYDTKLFKEFTFLGANEAVLRMLAEIGTVQNVPGFIKRVKGGEGRLMGFGHRVYKSYDPRATIIKKTADEVFEVTGKNPLLDIALELERIALEDDYFISRKLYPNVDFYSGLIYQAMGFPVTMFPVLFAIPRTSGWIAQWEEMLLDPEQKIARPRQVYIGPARRDYVPLSKRT